MKYKEKILTILSRVGKRGISVRLLSKHVYNESTTIFSQPVLENVKRGVQQYLQYNSKTAHPLVERTEKRGCYRITRLGMDYVKRLEEAKPYIADSEHHEGELFSAESFMPE